MSKRVYENIKCPICGKEFKQLNTHIIYEHNMSIEEFKEHYPNHKLNGKVTIIKDNKEYICEICGYKCSSKAGLTNHKSRKHNIKKEKRKNKEGIKCEICGNIYKQLSQHIKTKHNMHFDEYKEKYNYNGPGAYFSQDHKKSLSDNKKAFYETDEGLKQRKDLSKRYSSDENPAKRKEVREKISKKAMERFVNNKDDNFQKYSYGLRTWFDYNNKSYFCRSFEEFMIIYSLLENNIEFEYEKHIFKYNDCGVIKNYLLDLYLPYYKKFYEIKAYSKVKIEEEIETDGKYKSIIYSLNKIGKELKIVNKSMFFKDLKIKFHNKFYFYDKLKELIKEKNANVSIAVFGNEYKGEILNMISDDWKNDKNIELILV